MHLIDIHEVTIPTKEFQEIFFDHRNHIITKNNNQFKIDDMVILNEYDEHNNLFTNDKMGRKILNIGHTVNNEKLENNKVLLIIG